MTKFKKGLLAVLLSVMAIAFGAASLLTFGNAKAAESESKVEEFERYMSVFYIDGTPLGIDDNLYGTFAITNYGKLKSDAETTFYKDAKNVVYNGQDGKAKITYAMLWDGFTNASKLYAGVEDDDKTAIRENASSYTFFTELGAKFNAAYNLYVESATTLYNIVNDYPLTSDRSTSFADSVDIKAFEVAKADVEKTGAKAYAYYVTEGYRLLDAAKAKINGRLKDMYDAVEAIKAIEYFKDAEEGANNEFGPWATTYGEDAITTTLTKNDGNEDVYVVTKTGLRIVADSDTSMLAAKAAVVKIGDDAPYLDKVVINRAGAGTDEAPYTYSYTWYEDIEDEDFTEVAYYAIYQDASDDYEALIASVKTIVDKIDALLAKLEIKEVAAEGENAAYTEYTKYYIYVDEITEITDEEDGLLAKLESAEAMIGDHNYNDLPGMLEDYRKDDSSAPKNYLDEIDEMKDNIAAIELLIGAVEGKIDALNALTGDYVGPYAQENATDEYLVALKEAIDAFDELAKTVPDVYDHDRKIATGVENDAPAHAGHKDATDNKGYLVHGYGDLYAAKAQYDKWEEDVNALVDDVREMIAIDLGGEKRIVSELLAIETTLKTFTAGQQEFFNATIAVPVDEDDDNDYKGYDGLTCKEVLDYANNKINAMNAAVKDFNNRIQSFYDHYSYNDWDKYLTVDGEDYGLKDLWLEYCGLNPESKAYVTNDQKLFEMMVRYAQSGPLLQAWENAVANLSEIEVHEIVALLLENEPTIEVVDYENWAVIALAQKAWNDILDFDKLTGDDEYTVKITIDGTEYTITGKFAKNSPYYLSRLLGTYYASAEVNYLTEYNKYDLAQKALKNYLDAIVTEMNKIDVTKAKDGSLGIVTEAKDGYEVGDINFDEIAEWSAPITKIEEAFNALAKNPTPEVGQDEIETLSKDAQDYIAKSEVAAVKAAYDKYVEALEYNAAYKVETAINYIAPYSALNKTTGKLTVEITLDQAKTITDARKAFNEYIGAPADYTGKGTEDNYKANADKIRNKEILFAAEELLKDLTATLDAWIAKVYTLAGVTTDKTLGNRYTYTALNDSTNYFYAYNLTNWKNLFTEYATLIGAAAPVENTTAAVVADDDTDPYKTGAAWDKVTTGEGDDAVTTFNSVDVFVGWAYTATPAEGAKNYTLADKYLNIAPAEDAELDAAVIGYLSTAFELLTNMNAQTIATIKVVNGDIATLSAQENLSTEQFDIAKRIKTIATVTLNQSTQAQLVNYSDFSTTVDKITIGEEFKDLVDDLEKALKGEDGVLDTTLANVLIDLIRTVYNGYDDSLKVYVQEQYDRFTTLVEEYNENGNENITSLDKAISDLNKAITDLNTAVAGKADAATIATKLENLEKAIAAANAEIAKANTAIDGLGTDLTAAQNAIAALQKDLADAKKDYADADASLRSDLEGQIGELETALKSLIKAEEDARVSGDKTNADAIAKLKTDLEKAINDAKTALQGNITEVANALANTDKTLEKAQADIKALQGDVDGLKGDVDGIKTDVKKLQSSVTGLTVGIIIVAVAAAAALAGAIVLFIKRKN